MYIYINRHRVSRDRFPPLSLSIQMRTFTRATPAALDPGANKIIVINKYILSIGGKQYNLLTSITLNPTNRLPDLIFPVIYCAVSIEFVEITCR